MSDAQIIQFPTPPQKYSHVYNPWDKAWENAPYDQPVAITDTTDWFQLCDSTKTMTNAEYQASFDEDEPDMCPQCLKKMKEDDPDGIIYNY